MELFAFPEHAAGIRGVAVPTFFPEEGAIHSVLFGEAPGPRGADRSGIPFWGDGAGLPLYRALVRAGCASVPEAAWQPWDGARFVGANFRPTLRGVALSNAFASCPSNDGRRFRAPNRAELQSPANQQRLVGELELAIQRGARQVITLGRCAKDTLAPLALNKGLALLALPHPSAQGLLSDAPNRGKGCRLGDLQAAWEDRLVRGLLGA